MLSGTNRWVVAFLLAAALALLPPAGQARAQCRGGQQQGRSRLFALSAQYPTQQPYASVYPVQQAMLQQYALLAAQQQQYALLAALQQQPNARQALLQAQLPLLNAGAARPPRPAPTPQDDQTVPPPADPEEAAARQFKIARALVADARRVEDEGEGDRAARMRRRAGERLQDLVRKYPGTRAAERAQDLLEELDR